MQFTMQCKIVAAFMLALASGQFVAAGRSLLQDAPTGVIMCDVAIVGGGPGNDFVVSVPRQPLANFVHMSGLDDVSFGARQCVCGVHMQMYMCESTCVKAGATGPVADSLTHDAHTTPTARCFFDCVTC